MAKAKAAGAKAAWQSLTGGKGYMGVSLHSGNHTGDGLAAIVDWVNTIGQFSEFVVGLSDTLNRYNYVRDKNLTLSEAYALAAQNGDAWLKDNAHILSRLAMPHAVIRWSHWLDGHARDVENNRDRFRSAYENDWAFRASMDADIAAFLHRKETAPGAKTIASCRDYLIEELAVYSVILDHYPSTVIYPGKQLNCFAHLRENQPDDLPGAIGKSGFIRLSVHGLNRAEPTQPQRRVA